MRLYGRRFAQKYVDDRTVQRTETRDAVLWSVDEAGHTCRVKIQGSPHLIVAHYPRNWHSRPYWLKPGNAVRILHRSGVRGYVEVVGEGRAIPTPIDGPTVPPVSMPDKVLSGMLLRQTAVASNSVIITSGTYRIDSVIYVFAPDDAVYIIMSDPPPMVMGTPRPMGLYEYTLAMPEPPTLAGYFRFDVVVIGTDGIPYAIQGDEVKGSEPVKPSVPARHVLIDDYILRKPDDDEIDQYEIGQEWYLATPSSLELTHPDDFPWDEYNDTPEVSIIAKIRDQWGAYLPGTYLLKLHMQQGSGWIWSAMSGYQYIDETHPTIDVFQTITSTYQYTFKYKRNQNEIDGEGSPVLTVSMVVDGVDKLVSAFYILLLNIDGDPLY